MKTLKVTSLFISCIIVNLTIGQLTMASKATRHASKELVEESISKRSDTLGDLVKPYQFGYQIKDKDGNVQHRHEESDAEGVKRGSYGYVDANGVYRKVFYVADKNGFRIKEMKSNEPGFDAKVAAAMKETSKIKTPVDTIASTASAHYTSPSSSVSQLSPSLLSSSSSDGSTYNPSKVTSSDREFNNQRVKASFNLNTSESKKDSSKAKHSNVYQSITNKVKDNHSHNHHHHHHNHHHNNNNNNNNNKVISHSSLPETALRPPYTETYSTSSDGLINNPSYSRDIGSSGDTRREFTHEPYVYYAQPSLHATTDNGHASLPLMPVRSIDTTFPYKFVSPRGIYNNNGDSNSVSSGNPLQSSHSMPIYSSVSSSPSSGKHMSPYLQALPIHTYRAPVTNTSSSNYGVNYASNSPPKTVYIPVYPPIMPHNHDHHSYGNHDATTYAPSTPHYGPFESTRLRAPEPTSSTTLGYMHPLQPVRSATTPAYSSPPSDKYHHHHHHPHHAHHHSNYNSPPIDNSIDRPSDHVKHHHRHPDAYSPHHSHSPANHYSPYSGYGGPSSPPSSSPSHERPLQYLDGPGPGSMIGTNRMQPTVFYVADSENDDHLVKKQHTDPSGYDDVPPPHRTGHDPTPHGFESPFIDVPPTAPPVPPPEADNNSPPPGAGPPGGPGGPHHHGSAGGPNNGHSPHDHALSHHPHHHHHASPDHLSGYPSPPTPPGHPSNPYYNPYNPYASAPASGPGNNMITDPARARLASYYQAVRQAAPVTPSSTSLSVSPSTSSSPSTLNVPSVLLGIQSAQGLEVATSLGSLSDTDINYNPSHYPTPDQLSKWKARSKSSSYRRNRNRNSILNIDDDSDDDSVITSSSDVDLQRIKVINSTHRVQGGQQKIKSTITATKMSPSFSSSSSPGDQSTSANESSFTSTVLTRLPTWFGGLR